MHKVYGISAIILATIMLAILRLDMRTDISDFFFAGEKADTAFLINQFKADSLQRRTILSIAHATADPEEVLSFVETFRHRLEALDGIERVWSSALDESSMAQLLELYTPYNANLLSLSPEEYIPTLFEQEQLQQRVARIKSAILGPDPGQVKTVIRKDPMLLTLDWLDQIRSSFSQSKRSEDYSILFLETKSEGMNIAAQEIVHQQIQQIFTMLNQSQSEIFQLATTGVPVFAMGIKSEVSQDIQRVSLLSSAAIIILFILVFRAPKTLILISFLLVGTVSAAVLITQSIFGYVHGLTLALGATLIGVCIDYFIHAMVHGTVDGPGQSASNIRKIWPSLKLGGATTLIGYFALASSGFPGLQQIAVFSASGVAIALLITRFAVPEYIQALQLSLYTRPRRSRLLAITRLKLVRYSLPIAAAGCFALGFSGLTWSDNLQSLSPNLEQLKENDHAIRSNMTSIEPGRFILVEGEDTEQALQRSEQIYSMLDNIQKAGELDHYFSVFPWMASKALQARNQESWNQQMSSQPEENWHQALIENGFSADAFPQLKTVENLYLSPEELKTTPAWAWLSRQVIQQQDKTLIVIWLGPHQPASLKQVLALTPGARYFSQREQIDALAADYRKNAAQMLIWGLLVILLLLFWRFRSIFRALRVLSPAMLAIVFVLGIAGLNHAPLNMLHLVGLLLTAAICVDYGIFFSENRGGDYRVAFQAISASAMTSAASFASLSVAQNPALQALAWTVAPGILIGFLLCPILLKPQPPSLV